MPSPSWPAVETAYPVRPAGHSSVGPDGISRPFSATVDESAGIRYVPPDKGEV